MKKRILRKPKKEGPGKRGAPLGNHNALKHGRYTRECRALNADIRAYIHKGRALVQVLLGTTR